MNVNTMPVIDVETPTKQDLIEIYEQFSPGIYRYAIRLLGDKNTQKIVSQRPSAVFCRQFVGEGDPLKMCGLISTGWPTTGSQISTGDSRCLKYQWRLMNRSNLVRIQR